MANRVALLTPLLAWTAALLAAQWPASVMASELRCGPDVRPAWCSPRDSTRDDLWQASIECSDDAITIQVQQTGDRSSIRAEYYREVLIQCTNGNDQAEISVNCTIQEERTYTRTISDLSTLGIESGWTCSFSGCFQVDFNNARSYYHTPTDSCTLPIDPTTTEEPTTTSTEAVTEPTTTSTEADVTMTMGTITSTEVDSGTNATVPPMLNLTTRIALVIIPIIVVLLGLITVTSLMILFINSRMKQQKARKTALLILDRNNMVFDPDYTPGIHIDQQSYYTHRTSMISNMDYLHFVVEKPSQYPADVQVVTFDENSYAIDSSVDHDLNMSNSKQHSSTMVGAAKDMVINPQEFPGSGTSGYIFSGDSNGFTSPQQMDTTELEFQSPSDSASELTQSCGGCQSSDYIGDARLGNPSLMYDNVIAASQETSSEDTLSFFTPEDDPLKEAAGVVGLDRSSYPSSSSSAGYVEQLNASNQPLTRDDDNVFEPTHQQGDNYVQSQHPIPITSSSTTFSDQTSGYIVDLQNTHQLHTNLQDTEVACLDLDDMNCSQTVSNSTSDVTQPTHLALKSCDQTFPLDMPHLTNTDGYIVNEHPTATASEDCETPELSIDLDCENTHEEGETDCEELSHDIYGSSVEDRVNGHSLDKPCSPDKISSQGYITTEDIDMTKFTSREIVVPSNQVSPSQIEPGFTVHLDFNNGIDSCHGQEKDEVGYVCNSGCSGSEIETDRNRDMIHHSQSSNQMAIDSNSYVANQPASILGTDKREQYVAYDFHSMSSELRDSQSTSVTPEPMATHNPDLGQMHVHYQAKSNYYPASDMSSGYLSGSSVSGDTSVYMGMDKFEQLDLYNYK